MRIAIVCPYYPWPPSTGGVETIVRDVSTELAKRRHEIHVVTTPFDVTTGKRVADYGIEKKNNVFIHKLRSIRLNLGYARRPIGLKGIVEEINPQIVHSHCLHPHLFQLIKWKNRVGYKLLIELHHASVVLEKLTAKITAPVAFCLLKRNSGNIDTFVTHTNLESEWLMERNIHKAKVAIVRLPAISSRLLKDYSLISNGDHTNTILFLGRVTWIKGVHILINAFANISKDYPGTKLIIAGLYDLQYKRYLDSLIRKLNLSYTVKFVGAVYGDKKIRLIRSSKIFVLPSLKEYTPCVLLESQALGVPVIATKVGAVSEMIINGKTGLLVEPGNALKLSKAIEILLENNDLRKYFSIKAKEFASQYTLETEIKKLENLYYKAIENERSSKDSSVH